MANSQTTLIPRIVRARDAHSYLGMSRDEFNKSVRPYVREFPIGVQGVGFDRYELDAWADDYIERNAIEKRHMETSKLSFAAQVEQGRSAYEKALEKVLPKSKARRR